MSFNTISVLCQAIINSLCFTADGVTYTFGMFLVELREYFHEGAGATAWIPSILVGVTLCSGDNELCLTKLLKRGFLVQSFF